MDAKYQPYKRYDDEFQRNAVELLESSGRPMAEVAGDLATRSGRTQLITSPGGCACCVSVHVHVGSRKLLMDAHCGP